MRILLFGLLLSLSAWSQPRLEELSEPERAKFEHSLTRKAFPGHECVGLAHLLRLLKVNGKVHGLALHQASLNHGLCSWNHYLWDGRLWHRQGVGLPDPTAGDDHLVLPEPAAEEIQRNFQDLVRCLRLQQWPRSAQERFLDASKIHEI